MHTTDDQSSSSLRLISVDISLCGSIPRRDLKSLVPIGAPCSLQACLTSRVQYNALSPSCFATTNGRPSSGSTVSTTEASSSFRSLIDHKNIMRGTLSGQQPLAPVVEPPSWAIPAKGETRLEPVCEALGRQTAVDLTTKSFYRIGRSPNSDIHLRHDTSSRRHAMICHHSNGYCYIIDCGSAHGTYVNGARIKSPVNGGLVVPHRVRRGALIRFGGPGAPCFLLKSFSYTLDEIDDLPSQPDKGELVRRNTRINAQGQTAAELYRSVLSETIGEALIVTGKRSFDSLDSSSEEPCPKRVRCSSPPLSPLEPIHLVSPELPAMRQKTFRVRFSPEPPQLFFPAIVTPAELSGDEDN